jgi:hypothetical protein
MWMRHEVTAQNSSLLLQYINYSLHKIWFEKVVDLHEIKLCATHRPFGAPEIDVMVILEQIWKKSFPTCLS